MTVERSADAWAEIRDRVERSAKAPDVYQVQADKDAQFMLGAAETFKDEWETVLAENAALRDRISVLEEALREVVTCGGARSDPTLGKGWLVEKHAIELARTALEVADHG